MLLKRPLSKAIKKRPHSPLHDRLKMLTLGTVGLFLSGILIGAVAVDILNVKSPELMKKVREQAKNLVNSTDKTKQKIQ